MRVIVDEGVRFPEAAARRFLLGDWPASWVAVEDGRTPPFVAVYRLGFDVAEAQTVRIHVSADQRYELLLNGQRIGRGPERGDGMHWFYETYDLPLEPGGHVLVARTWYLDHDAWQPPTAQVSRRHGFLLAAEGPMGPKLNTGVAPWQARKLGGYTFHTPPTLHTGHLAGGTITLDGRAHDWDWRIGGGEGWSAAFVVERAKDRINGWGESSRFHRLRPARLPAMLDAPRAGGIVRTVAAIDSADCRDVPLEATAPGLEAEVQAWQAMLAGGPAVRIPARTRRRVLVDLQDYVCAYPQLTLSGGRDAVVRLGWAESLFVHPSTAARRALAEKGHRGQWLGKYFRGRGDTFIADGGEKRLFDTLWWECGCYLEIIVETADQPLSIDRLELRETRYPLEMEGRVELSDPRFNAAVPIMWRTLQMCSHETYMDCPYYEQLMYTGDTRLEALVTYLMTADDRLPRKAITMFGVSQSADGLTGSRYPAHVEQVIPQFSLFFVAMLHDFALWRGDREFVLRFMPRARQVLEIFIGRMDEAGLVRWPEGWNWIDWVPDWHEGNPLPDPTTPNGINQWQFVYVMGLAAKLERWLGETELAGRLQRIRARAAAAAIERFWDESRGLVADTLEHDRFSEHAQCYALLSGLLDEQRRKRAMDGLLTAPDLARATIYFQHYLFEVLCTGGRADAILDRMRLWFDLPGQGLHTCLEMPEPSRSDCHAWGAHPLYHACASLAGVRPAGLGSDEVLVRPQLGPLERVYVELFLRRGRVRADLRRSGDRLSGSIDLPDGVTGRFVHPGQDQPLVWGRNELR